MKENNSQIDFFSTTTKIKCFPSKKGFTINNSRSREEFSLKVDGLEECKLLFIQVNEAIFRACLSAVWRQILSCVFTSGKLESLQILCESRAELQIVTQVKNQFDVSRCYGVAMTIIHGRRLLNQGAQMTSKHHQRSLDYSAIIHDSVPPMQV